MVLSICLFLWQFVFLADWQEAVNLSFISGHRYWSFLKHRAEMCRSPCTHKQAKKIFASGRLFGIDWVSSPFLSNARTKSRWWVSDKMWWNTTGSSARNLSHQILCCQLYFGHNKNKCAQFVRIVRRQCSVVEDGILGGQCTWGSQAVPIGAKEGAVWQ